MKKRPYTQMLNGIDITYSILPKKQNTFFLTHDRFLFLNGIESISYARTFEEKIILPFQDKMTVPKFKTTYNIQ
jgi:hypothetical protein